MRLFAWSDLHVDYPANRELLAGLSREDHQEDVLMVAGDLSNDLDRLLGCLLDFKERFREVAFVPGNHDLWVAGGSRMNSLEKLHELRALCRAREIRVSPFDIGLDGRMVRVVPLVSWYLKPEEGEGSLFLPKPAEDPALSMWADNHRIKWPPMPDGQTPAAHLLSLARETANLPATCVPSKLPSGNAVGDRGSPGANREPESGRPEPRVVVTFSHFLPRVELVFSDWEKFRSCGRVSGSDRNPAFNFTRVAGCRQLDEVLRAMGSTLHVYGHQHRNRDRTIDGVRYVSHCLGYPSEWSGLDTGPARHEPLEIQLNAAS